MIHCAVLGLGLALGAVAHAKVYRCTVDGALMFTDRPCADLDSERRKGHDATPEMPGSVAADRDAGSGRAPASPGAPAKPQPAAQSDSNSKCGTGDSASCRSSARRKSPASEETPARLACANGDQSVCAASVDVPAGAGWHLAGEYSDRIEDPDAKGKTLKRASYGIECDASRIRRRVYSIDNRFTLLAPGPLTKNKIQGPIFATLALAAAAACAAN